MIFKEFKNKITRKYEKIYIHSFHDIHDTFVEC